MSKDRNNMSFLDHLGELRWHLVRSSIAIFFFAVVAFLSKEVIFDVIIFGPKQMDFPTYTFFCWLSSYVGGNVFCFDEMPFELLNMRMSGQFQMHLWVSLVAGVIIAFPYVFWEIWRFIQPGLHESERKNSRGVILFTTVLFLLGVLFGYYVIVPLSVQFLGTYTVSSEIFNRIDLTSYISMVSSVTLATGILFQLPIAVYFLSKLGVVTPDLLKTYRRHAIVGILLLSAIITPPDIASQILVTFPVLILYQISIGVSRRIIKSRAKTKEI
ncbi:twin-arginine translocase subunit TatC [Schleiferiaceae bacterium]|jgi:sec-independent protein translocase protein TatC|nr:twin-arginine translocase subunit TatC [Schleiferiaceae bacterium]PSR08225.1 MAG: twin-arginine translocase subunit TatC [Bacteroidota bacterium]